jgi:uncharacterized membrane protein YdjX (TVP38/TMEM64 family)
MNDSGMSTPQAIASAIVAVAFLALVGLMFWRATEPGANFGAIWGSTSAIVGVVIGVIPSFFFRSQAKAERARSAQLGDRNTALAAAASVQQVMAAMKIAPHAFPPGAQPPAPWPPGQQASEKQDVELPAGTEHQQDPGGTGS